MSDVNLKDDILINATMLFAQSGFSKTSIQKIADLSKTSQTNILYHFKTKKKLFEACLSCAIKKNRLELSKDNSLSKKDSLLFLLNTNIKWATKSPKDCQLFLLLYYFSSSDEYFRKLTIQINQDAKELLKSYIIKLKPKSNLTLDQVISLLQNYIHGVMFNIVARKEKEIESNYREAISDFVDLLFD